MHRLDASLASDLGGVRRPEGGIVVGTNTVQESPTVRAAAGVHILARTSQEATCTFGQLLPFSQNYYMGQV